MKVQNREGKERRKLDLGRRDGKVKKRNRMGRDGLERHEDLLVSAYF